jgi:TonB family protein
MTRALLYQPGHKWRFCAALAAAGVIHLAAISFANLHRTEGPVPSGVLYEPPEVTFEAPPSIDPPADLSDPLPTPPPADLSFPEEKSTPPPIRRQVQKFMPFVKPKSNATAGSLNLSSAKVLAINAPRPEYPYEARRQKITGDGVVVMTIDPVTGNVTDVMLSKSTGSPFLDNAALSGFKRWRFRPGTVSSVTCPVTFTLTGAAY